jgi:hypothetical protein
MTLFSRKYQWSKINITSNLFSRKYNNYIAFNYMIVKF